MCVCTRSSTSLYIRCSLATSRQSASCGARSTLSPLTILSQTYICYETLVYNYCDSRATHSLTAFIRTNRSQTYGLDNMPQITITHLLLFSFKYFLRSIFFFFFFLEDMLDFFFGVGERSVIGVVRHLETEK